MPNKILIVDDFPIFRVGLKAMLSKVANLEVVGEAEAGITAVLKASTLKPDLIMMDLTMPGTNVPEIIRKIKQNEPAIKVLALAEHNSHDSLKAAIASGANGYIVKDDTAANLLSAIECVLDGHVYLSAGLSHVTASGSPETDVCINSKQLLWANLIPFYPDKKT